MARTNTSSNESCFFNLAHAKWVAGVLGMLIAVVGEDSLLGLLLRQTRLENPHAHPGRTGRRRGPLRQQLSAASARRCP